MLKLKNAVLFQEQFSKSLKDISKLTKLSIKEIIEVSKALEVCEKEFKSIQPLYADIAKKNCLKDDKGELVIENNSFVFASKENLDSFLKETNDLFEVEFDIPLSKKIKVSEDNKNFTLETYEVLKDIIEVENESV